jgi:thiol-disulfide isomerase/thioredoxin
MPRNKHSLVYTNVANLSLLLLVFASILLNSCAYTPQPLRPFPTPETAPIGIEIGMRCPNLVFQDEQGQRKEVEDYRGKIVFINLWGSWCIPCQREMPSIQELYDNLKNDEGIVFLLLSTKTDFDESKRWARSLGYSVPRYMSTPPGDRPMINVRTIPRTLILDRNGIVIMSKTGEENWIYWLECMRDLIRTSAITTRRHYSFPADGGRLEVEVTEGNPNSNLRLSLVTENGVKLSAKRGIVITPSENSSVKWVTPMPVTRIEEDMDYFSDTPELTLFFVSSVNSGMVDLKIEYGYCKTNSEECILAKAVIEVPIHKQD